MLVCLFQPAYSLLSVIGIFLCTVICITDQETTSASFILFNHLTVTLGLFQYPALYFLTFILYLRADFLNNNNSDIAGTMSLLSDKHS